MQCELPISLAGLLYAFLLFQVIRLFCSRAPLQLQVHPPSHGEALRNPHHSRLILVALVILINNHPLLWCKEGALFPAALLPPVPAYLYSLLSMLLASVVFRGLMILLAPPSTCLCMYHCSTQTNHTKCSKDFSSADTCLNHAVCYAVRSNLQRPSI